MELSGYDPPRTLLRGQTCDAGEYAGTGYQD